MAWEMALGGVVITTNTFSNPIPSAQTIALDTGIISTNSIPPLLPNLFDNNSVNAGVYGNATQAGTDNSASNTIDWTFPKPIIGFGADFISASIDRLTLSADFDGKGPQTLTVYASIGAGNGFLGVVGSSAWTSLRFGNAMPVVDSFSIDNASYAVPGPLPALGATVAIGWSRRLKQRLKSAQRALPTAVHA